MRNYKIILFIISILVSFYLAIVVIPIDVYIKLLDENRKINKIKTIESIHFSYKENSSFIYSSSDTLDAFFYKVVEIRRNYFGIPIIVGEADYYHKNHLDLERIYFWKSSFLNPKVENQLNILYYTSDSIITPLGKIEAIRSCRYISTDVADSIIEYCNQTQ